jgi:hypothetical protein
MPLKLLVFMPFEVLDDGAIMPDIAKFRMILSKVEDVSVILLLPLFVLQVCTRK